MRLSLSSSALALTAVLFLMFLACGFVGRADGRSAASGLYEVKEIKPGVFLWIPEDVLDVDGDPQFSRTANSGFLITTEGVVVINTTNSPFHAREVLYEIRERTEQPVRYVINTDSHGDVMMGNEVFVDQKAAIIATTVAEEEMRDYRADLAERLREDENWRLQGRMRGIHPTPATEAFDTQMTLLLGGEQIHLVRMSGGHSEGDLVVRLPAQKVDFLGHLFENGFFPRFASSDVRRWIENLRQIESEDVEIFVPAHGPPGGKKQLAEFRQFLEWLLNEVNARMQEGKSLVDIKRELNLTETYHWSARELASHDIEEVFNQLTSEQQGATKDSGAPTRVIPVQPDAAR